MLHVRTRLLPVAGLALTTLLVSSGGQLNHLRAEPQASAPPAAAAPSGAIFKEYCISCHSARLKTAGLSLEGVDPSQIEGQQELLEKVVKKLRTGQMPPEGRPRPDAQTVEAFTTSLETSLDRLASKTENPGHVVSRRLNRAEYVNVMKDLLGLNVDGAALLPSDMAGFGFDNNADVLSVTPALMSRYMTAATKISRLAVSSPDNRPMTQAYKVEYGSRQDTRMNEQMPFATHGGMAIPYNFPLDGNYSFAIRMKKNGTVSTIDGIEQDEHQIELRIDHVLVKAFKIGGKLKGPDPGQLIAVSEDDIEGQKVHDYRVNADKELEITLPVTAGNRLVTVSFTDTMPTPEFDTDGARSPLRGMNQPGIDTVYIGGPFNGRTPKETASRQRIFVCHPSAKAQEDACATKIVSTLARRAYRRPVTEAEVGALMNLYREGRATRDFEFGVERALEGLLSSPKFLIRVERDPAGAKPGTVYALSDLELASRLSFFLWRSMPDDQLLDVAARKQLKDPKTLGDQVRRMLADSRSDRFLNDFVEQWLTIRNIRSIDPDSQLFPGFDPTLRESMARETELFFASQVREDRPIPELLTANYSFLNERLARHYGLNDIYGSHFRRVTLTDERRFGILGQASVLLTTSYSNRTSVVLRGKWVLENLLGAPPPPPPPNVPPLKENKPGEKPESLRARMEQHRQSAVCASCHSRMDPLGFALEHFDAIGQWRENDGGAEINSTITLDGQTIDNPKAFRNALVHKGNQFVDTVIEKMLTYALGRGVTYEDAPLIRQMTRDLEKASNRWSALIVNIVESTPFRMRMVPETPEPAPTVASAR